MGHYKSECPQCHKLEESHLVVDLVDKADEVPTREEQKEVFLRATQNPVIMEGKVDGKKVEQIYLDPGSSKTFVSRALVEQASLTSKTIEVKTINPGCKVYPVANVNIEVGGYKTELEVCVHSNLSYDVLLGRDFPFLWEVGFCKVNRAVCHMVKTRQQQRKEFEENQCDMTALENVELQSEVLPGVNSSGDDDFHGENLAEEAEMDDIEGSSLESVSQLDEDGNVNTHASMSDVDDHNENSPLFSVIEPEEAKKVFKSKLKRSEKRVGKQAHAALQALPKELDDCWENMKNEQMKDPSLKVCWKKVESRDERFIKEQGLLWRKVLNKSSQPTLQLVVPKIYRSVLLKLAHKPGHLGRKATLAQLSEHFYWPGMYRDVKTLCEGCVACQKIDKLRKRVVPLQPSPIIDTPFLRIAIDFVGPLPRTKQGKKYILVLMDYTTRWPEAKAVLAPTSRTAADMILDICCRFGVPKEILTDRGSHLVNSLLKTIYTKLGIRHITTTPYHPQTDGMVERFNGTLKTMLKRSFCSFHGQWDLALPLVSGEYRSTPCRATGFTPAKLLLGGNIRTPLKVLKEQWTAKENEPNYTKKNMGRYVTDLVDGMEKMRVITKENEKMYKTKCKEVYDKKAKERKLVIGDLVLVRNPVKKIHGFNQELSGANKYNKLHINLLERYITPTLESFFTEEVLHNNIDFGPDLMGGDGSKIADPEIFLERKERKRLRKLIGNFKDVLQSKPGKTKSTCIEIKTGDAYPIHMTAYRVAPRRLPLLEEEIKTLLREGIIEPSNSQWAFPAILVPKLGGAVRLCIDYRK